MNAIVNDESEFKWKETTFIYFNILCGPLFHETKKNPLKISE
jgi:hypothetical protein